MMRVSSKRMLYVLFFVFISISLSRPGMAESLHGDLPTGLVQLDDYQHPVFLYVPEKYTPEHRYPLIVTVPDEGESPEENIKFWLSVAKRKSMLVLAPAYIRQDDVPYRYDEWFLKVKRDVTNKYHIADGKTFLMGKDGGAHYASYLGTNYDDEFSAVVLLGGSWAGKFEKLLKLKSSAVDQVPFYVALPRGEANLLDNTKRVARKFEKKGYRIFLDEDATQEKFEDNDYKRQLLSWSEEASLEWQDVVRESQKSTKEKIKTWFKNFISL